MCAWSEERVTSPLAALTAAHQMSSEKCVRFSEAAANEQRSRCAPKHAVSPPAGPLSLSDLCSTVRTVKRTSWISFAAPQCVPGATGALKQVVPYMDAETPGQASRK